MKARTHAFAVAVVVALRPVNARVIERKAERLADQLVGAAWGSGRKPGRVPRAARTHKEFTSKLGTVVEEADEAEELLSVIH